jgi:2-C-methyl-D-erythritol 4-phosphate cytidylyltransferase/2-C-methyl-D-erythritol 2,4-cyclodiphosphate synthase
MKVVAAILAAGRGTRFGGDKTRALLGGKPVWRWSFDCYSSHSDVSEVMLIGSASNLEELGAAGRTLLGGDTRQSSSKVAVGAAGDADIVLLHDAARPFVSREVVSRVIEGVERTGAAAAAIPVIDTIKQNTDEGWRTLDRSRLVAMQTPQGARVDLLRAAHAQVSKELTDEMAVLEAFGHRIEIVEGESRNFKITTEEDLNLARMICGMNEIRVGFGYDIHAFSADPARPCVLGGVTFEGESGLEGHSDADVLIHAVVDAILGAAALGDIGEHFPNTDASWRGEASSTFLRHAAALVREQGFAIVNVDATLIGERPRVMGRATEIRRSLADTLGIATDRVSIKATTNEGLGSLGRSEGIACHAVATLTRI